MKICLDTNVLVSAFATRGLCADVMKLVLSRHELICPAAILAEFSHVLRIKLKVPQSVHEEACAVLGAFVTPMPQLSGKSLAGLDAADSAIVASAAASGAELFVTGDAEIQRVAAIGRMRVLSPRDLWELSRT